MTAHWLDDVRPPPTPDALARMVESIAPGSRLVHLRRLGGGLGAAMHRFDLLAPDGSRQRLALRRYPRLALREDPDLAARCWQCLSALQRLGVAAPAPVWADLDGLVFGTQAFVMTRLRGRSVLNPSDLHGWLEELGVALARLHRTALAGVDLRFLGTAQEAIDRYFTIALHDARRPGPRGEAVQEALIRWRDRLRRMTPVLCHGDYWAGNTLWLRGRITAIIDWDSATIGYPGIDVGYCRMDVALQHGGDAPDRFLRAYESAAGMRVPQLHIWDLVGAAQALPDPERWLPGLHELGRRDMTATMLRERLTAFIDDALARS